MSAPARRRGSAGALLGVVSALFLPGGCDLFSTREPLRPDDDSTFWRPPTSPEIIVDNLVLAFENGIFGDYERALTEDFTFVPDAADVDRLEIERPGEDVFAGWTPQVETQVAEAIKSGADSVEVSLTLFEEQLLEDGRLRKYDYVLTLERGGSIDVHEGEMWLEIVDTGGEWFIARWEDVPNEATVVSWGLLKGRNRTL